MAPRTYSDVESEQFAYATGWIEGRASIESERASLVADRDAATHKYLALRDKLRQVVSGVVDSLFD